MTPSIAAAPRRCPAPLLTFLIAIALWLGLIGSACAASAPLSVAPETLLPLVRKFLFVTIVAIVLMSVVSSLGINIGRYWPVPGWSVSLSALALKPWCATSFPGFSS
jgi:hypothetical protein